MESSIYTDNIVLRSSFVSRCVYPVNSPQATSLTNTLRPVPIHTPWESPIVITPFKVMRRPLLNLFNQDLDGLVLDIGRFLIESVMVKEQVDPSSVLLFI